MAPRLLRHISAFITLSRFSCHARYQIITVYACYIELILRPRAEEFYDMSHELPGCLSLYLLKLETMPRVVTHRFIRMGKVRPAQNKATQ